MRLAAELRRNMTISQIISGALDDPRSRSERRTACRYRRSVDDQWGRSESIDPDNVGDIADEGAGHRG